ncbi:hypothetical protein LY78DRAFT_378638 [Colletotrichum sublineola]|nr:hypothetical protein LY78DRAFT_378638 [Colletotrichum sublineola]
MLILIRSACGDQQMSTPSLTHPVSEAVFTRYSFFAPQAGPVCALVRNSTSTKLHFWLAGNPRLVIVLGLSLAGIPLVERILWSKIWKKETIGGTCIQSKILRASYASCVFSGWAKPWPFGLILRCFRYQYALDGPIWSLRVAYNGRVCSNAINCTGAGKERGRPLFGTMKSAFGYTSALTDTARMWPVVQPAETLLTAAPAVPT